MFVFTMAGVRKFIRRRPRAIKYDNNRNRPASVGQRAIAANMRVSPARSLFNLPVGFPQTHTARLRYTSIKSYDAAASGIAYNVFSANGAYDPDITGVGHQPFGFDQWMTFYDHYTVIASRCVATFQHISTSAGTSPAICGLALSDSTTAVPGKPDVESLLESRISGDGTYHKFAGGNTDGQTTNNSLTRYFNASKFFNMPNVSGKHDLRGDGSSNPNEQAYFTPWVHSVLGYNPGDVSITVTIDYIVVFSEPKPVAQS